MRNEPSRQRDEDNAVRHALAGSPAALLLGLDDLDAAQVLAQDLGNHHGAVGALVLLDDGREDPGGGQTGAVQGVNEIDLAVGAAVTAVAAAGLVVIVNSETDFVAKNEEFQSFVTAVANQALKSDATDMDAFMAESWNLDSSKTVKDALTEKVAVIGENLTIRRFEKVVAENGCVVSYTHGGGRIGVIIEAETTAPTDEVKEALTNVAMQIAALNPKYISQEDVSEEYKEHEKAILLEQAKNDPKNAGKPDNIIEKMIIGRLNKELKEVCLLEQEYVKAENKESVGKYIEAVSKAAGADVKIKKFVRFETGEGIEKKQEDFAAEVAAQMAGN